MSRYLTSTLYKPDTSLRRTVRAGPSKRVPLQLRELNVKLLTLSLKAICFSTPMVNIPRRCTFTFIMKFFVPMLFVAIHWYNPPSLGLKFLIVRFPSLISVFPAGRGIINLVQVILGGGKPSAWQVSCIVLNSFGVVSAGGVLIKTGRPEKG